MFLNYNVHSLKIVSGEWPIRNENNTDKKTIK